jgi:hypothetical protein
MANAPLSALASQKSYNIRNTALKPPIRLRGAGRSIRRSFALPLHFGRLDPPRQIIGKARKRLFKSLAAVTRGRGIGVKGLSNYSCPTP